MSGENYIMRSLMSVLLTQYCSGDQIEKNEMGGNVECMGKSRGVYRILMGKPEGKNPLGKSRR